LTSDTEKLLLKLRKKPYREAYVGETVRRWMAHQIRAIRESRNWNQGVFAKKLGKPQSVLSRIEDPSYGKLSVQTLLEIAAAFDVALLIRFVSFPAFVAATRNLTTGAMCVDEFSLTQFQNVGGQREAEHAEARSEPPLKAAKVAGLSAAGQGTSAPQLIDPIAPARFRRHQPPLRRS
jgi:transcriptional regulator with XRE-family HTH domain